MQNPIEVSFPCPSCGVRLTILQTVANGPCPHCQVAIKVELKATVLNQNMDRQGSEEVVKLKNAFDRRRFRPASEAAMGNPKARQHPSKI